MWSVSIAPQCAPPGRHETRRGHFRGQGAFRSAKHEGTFQIQMSLPYELQIGWRYTRAGRTGRRNGFISFISGRLDARHRAGRGRADHRAVGDERLPEGGARPHAVGDRARRGVRAARRGAARLASQRDGGASEPAGASARRPSSPRRRWWRAATTCAAPSCAASRRPTKPRSPTWRANCSDATLAGLTSGSWNIVLGVELARS